MTDKDDERMISEADLADRFGCSINWCQARRLDGKGVPYHALSNGLIRYKIRDIEAFEIEKRRMSTSDPAYDRDQ